MLILLRKKATMTIVMTLVSVLLLGSAVQAQTQPTLATSEIINVLKVSDDEKELKYFEKSDFGLKYSISDSTQALKLVEQKSVDAIIVNEKELGNMEELLNKQFQQQGYILIYNGEGTLSAENVYDELGIDYAKTKENEIGWKQIGLGIYNRSDGVRVIHSLYSKEEKDISKNESELKEVLLQDLVEDHTKQPVQNSSTESFAALAGTPTPWNLSNTYYDAPYGNVTITRDYTPVRVNNNTKTAWAIHSYILTVPGRRLNQNGDSSYSYYAVTDDMTFRIAKRNSDEEINQASPNSTSSSSTASVSLSYPSAISASWTFASAGVQITHQSSTPTYGQWYEYFTGNTRTSSYSSQPGVVATNTGSYLDIDYTMYLDWSYNADIFMSLAKNPSDHIPDF
ncbi:hypothetical protein AAC978_03045 [Desulfitobacterium sp. THU1]|uniref:hypothetical protein n=1 Tax=Desulfitobacterium sp. THU1 TaxID=3138072 RepID=UPI00311F74CC